MRGHRAFLWDALVIAAVVAVAVTSCSDERTVERSNYPVPTKVTPTSVETSTEPAPVVPLFQDDGWTRADTGAWAVFDRDTASGWTPVLGEVRATRLRLRLEGQPHLTHLKVFGPLPYTLKL